MLFVAGFSTAAPAAMAEPTSASTVPGCGTTSERVKPRKPVVGASDAALAPNAGYHARIAEICREYGVLFVADCVISAFGRLGTWYGVERWGLQPDMITFAKGVTSGYLPLGGVVASGRVAAPFWDEGGLLFRHGPTYSGHPTCCAAALANLDILEREGLIERGGALETPLARALGALGSHELVGGVETPASKLLLDRRFGPLA